MSTGSRLPDQVIALLARGDTIGAVKLLRQTGGHGLREAMVAIEQHAASARAGHANAAPTHGSDGVEAALREGNVVEAIRRMRAANPGMDLKSAKQAVDGLRARAPGPASTAHGVHANTQRTPTVQDGDHGGLVPILLAVLAAAGALVWWWLG